MKKLLFILFMFYSKYFSLMINFYKSKHVALNGIYLVVLTTYLPSNFVLILYTEYVTNWKPIHNKERSLAILCRSYRNLCCSYLFISNTISSKHLQVHSYIIKPPLY